MKKTKTIDAKSFVKGEDGNVELRDVIIIGSGPAGFAAGLYTGRANLRPLIIAGNELGGQLSLTEDIENYPGFPPGMKANDLIQTMKAQAENFGAEVRYEYVHEVDFHTHPFKITTYGTEYQAKAVIITTGSSPRKLGVPGEVEYTGRGVSYCATCDGFFFKGKPVIVVGGGDAAVEEGLFLTRFVSSLTLVHRRDRLRAGQILQDRAQKNEKFRFVWDSIVEEIVGEDGKGVIGAKVRNVKTDEMSLIPVDGVFIFIGHEPNTDLFRGQIELDEKGYIISDKRQRTNIPGVFSGGDVQDHIYRQAITAAGTGAAAAMEAEKFIAELESRTYPGR